jgi:hypothetical protein
MMREVNARADLDRNDTALIDDDVDEPIDLPGGHHTGRDVYGDA